MTACLTCDSGRYPCPRDDGNWDGCPMTPDNGAAEVYEPEEQPPFVWQ
ncbi:MULTISPECIES: hypothetical protein [unclassified Streptomyces]